MQSSHFHHLRMRRAFQREQGQHGRILGNQGGMPATLIHQPGTTEQVHADAVHGVAVFGAAGAVVNLPSTTFTASPDCQGGWERQ